MMKENTHQQLLHPSGASFHIILRLHLKKGDVYFLIHPLLKNSHKPGKNKREEEDRRAI